MVMTEEEDNKSIHIKATIFQYYETDSQKTISTTMQMAIKYIDELDNFTFDRPFTISSTIVQTVPS